MLLLPYLCQNFATMTEQTPAQNRRFWLLFLVSFVVFTIMIIFVNEWFWVAMPFMLTYLVYSLKMI